MSAVPSPPVDLTAERATLGALLMERDAIMPLAGWLSPAHFYLEKHAWIYEAALACYHRREPPDIATVAAELRRRNRLDVVGGFSALADLVTEVPTAVHVEHYARAVEQAATGRALIELGGQIAALGFDASRQVDERLEQAGQLLYGLTTGRQVGQDFVTVGQVASEYLEAAAANDAPDGALLGISAGYADIDRVTQGLKAGELIILAARPGVGKTALALCIAYHAARDGRTVGVFSLEMDRELLVQRLVALHLSIPTTEVARGVRRGDARVVQALSEVAELPIHIDHTPSLNVLAIRDRARRLAAKAPVDLWIVDYLQLAQSGNARDDEVRRITQVSQGLTHMAREFRAPVLALSQLSRAVEGRADRVPMLSDLRGSGSIEQDASQVWFIYREELYDKEAKAGETELHVAKHRNGETGMVPLRFDRASTRFWSVDRYRDLEGY